MIPVDPKSKKATVKWADYQNRMPTDQELEQWFGKGTPGMAIVTGGISQLCVIDVDSHKHPDAIERIKPFLPEQETYPLAQSQSGGWHLYFKCNGELRGGVDMPFTGVDLRANGNYIICPPTPGYEWKRKIEDGGSNLIELSSSYIKELVLARTSATSMPRNEDSDTKRHEATRGYISFEEGSRDEGLFHVAHTLQKGGMAEGNIRKVLNILAENCNPPFPEKEVEIKIQSVIQRSETKIDNIAREIKEWVLATEGNFLTTDCQRELHLTTKEQKKAANAALSRLVAEKIIERHGDKRGNYRRVENQIEEIDFKDSDSRAVDVKWPFQIESLVKLHPGSLIVIAGEQNAGKTAFLLNFVKMNMNRGKEIYYASSEFGGEELKERLLNFEEMSIEDWNFHFFNRDSNFADTIQPNDINIIDYLEVTDAFYLVGGMLKDIWAKLDRGIAIVATQKSSNSSEGRGKSFSLEKARLALNVMDNYPAGQTLQIRKAKNYVDKAKNPNWLEIGFKIYGGCVLTPNGDWYHPEKKRR